MEEITKKVLEREKQQPINTVLVIDDDADWCFMSKIILKRAGVGEKIITAHNGQEAIKTLKNLAEKDEKLPELVFLDIRMPVMDGFEFLEEVTHSNEFDLSQTKIFMCTSSFLEKDKERAHQFPISGFITKPLTQDILKSILS